MQTSSDFPVEHTSEDQEPDWESLTQGLKQAAEWLHWYDYPGSIPGQCATEMLMRVIKQVRHASERAETEERAELMEDVYFHVFEMARLEIGEAADESTKIFATVEQIAKLLGSHYHSVQQ